MPKKRLTFIDQNYRELNGKVFFDNDSRRTCHASTGTNCCSHSDDALAHCPEVNQVVGMCFRLYGGSSFVG